MAEIKTTNFIGALDTIDDIIKLTRKKIKLLGDLRMGLVQKLMKEQEKKFGLQDIFRPMELSRVRAVWLMKRESFHSEVKRLLTDEKLAALKAKGFEFDRSYLAYAVEYLMTVRR